MILVALENRRIGEVQLCRGNDAEEDAEKVEVCTLNFLKMILMQKSALLP